MWAALCVSPVGARLQQLVTIVAFLQHASCQSQGCPAVIKNSSFPPEVVTPNELCVMRKSDVSKASSPSVINVNGLWGGDPSKINKTSGCGEDGTASFKMDCSRVTLSMDSTTCSCKAMTVQESSPTDKSVSMRLDFEKCTAGTATAVVKMAVKKVADAEMEDSGSLTEYFNTVCSKPTTTQISSIVKVNTNAQEVAIGAGSCAGTRSAVLPKANVPDRQTCSEVCLGLIEKFSAMSDADDKTESCTGYAFSEDSTLGSCLIYNSPVSKLNETGPDGSWKCWNMTGVGSFQESTEPPATAEELAAAVPKVPELKFNVTAYSAHIDVVSSKVTGCFEPYTWIDLEEKEGSPGYVPIKESEWTEFLSYVPVPTKAAATAVSPATDSVGCTTTSRSIYYGGSGGVYTSDSEAARAGVSVAAQASAAAAVGGTSTCAPTDATPDCTAEYINAAIVSILVPLLTWLCVYIAYDKCLKGVPKENKQARGDATATSFMTGSGTTFSRTAELNTEGDDGQVAQGCDMHVLLILVLVTALVAGITASLLAHILGFLLTPICAASSHDLNLITECISICAFIAIAVALWYLSTRHSAKVSGGDDWKYMLIKVKEGQGNHPVVMKNQIVEQLP